ncbi:unnamed protein product [Spirodela intermedia]|uniref:CASP-like protein n=1 Tax=Spirodela intermedia TaxID=51605 RepID=A0A7I8KE56_SPIIN|nr:unnamed protein product [Spirodela intermedia]
MEYSRSMETASEKKMTTGNMERAAEGGAKSSFNTAETILRVLSMGLCLAALVVMLKNTESSSEYGSVSYRDLSGFRYLVYANGICAAYSLLSAFYTTKAPRPANPARAWTLFFCDQMLTYVLLAAASAAAEILYLTHNGDDQVTWSKVCDMFGPFCRLAVASTGVTFGAAACYVGMSLVSSYCLFSAYDAPVPFLTKGLEVAVPIPR